MFCTSGGNSASVMSMRFVFNFIFFFLILYFFFFCPDRLLFLSLRPPPPFLSLPRLPFLPVFVSPLLPSPLSPAPPLFWSGGGISFHFDKSFCSSTATWMSWTEAGLGKTNRARQSDRSRKTTNKKRSEKEQTRAKFLCCGVAPNRRRQGES